MLLRGFGREEGRLLGLGLLGCGREIGMRLELESGGLRDVGKRGCGAQGRRCGKRVLLNSLRES